MQDFAEKLAFALKALAISRGRLAADVGVDKSVVGRWLNGRSAPSGESFSQLTRVIAARSPGFTGLDWEGDLTALAAKLGAPLDLPPGPPQETRVFEDWIRESSLHKVARAAGRLAPGLTGFWRTLLPLINEPGRFVQTHTMMSEVDRAIRVDTLLWGGRATGWAVVFGNQLYSTVGGDERFGISFMIQNGLDRLSAGVLDGLWLGCLPAMGGIVTATPAVSERIGELSEDLAADKRTLETLSRQPEVVEADQLPDAYVERLNTGRVPGGEAALLVPALTSLARAATSVWTPPASATPPAHLKVVQG